MSSAFSACKRFVFFGLVAGIAPIAVGETPFAPQGSEYPVIGSLPGDQVFPQMAVNRSGGYVVWQDNVTDGDGLGISARLISSGLSGSLGVFRVNQQGAGDQLNPKVALLKDGGSVIVWQGGAGASHIYARFLSANGTFATGDVLVNTYVQNSQIDP